MSEANQKTISPDEFKKLTGISQARMQRWSESGVLHPHCPTRRSDGRRFSMRDAIRARFMLELTGRGFSTQVARVLTRRVVSDFFNEQDAGDTGNLVAVIFGTTRYTADRIRIHGPRARLLPMAAAVNVITNHQGPTYLIPLAEISEQLRGRHERTKLNAFVS